MAYYVMAPSQYNILGKYTLHCSIVMEICNRIHYSAGIVLSYVHTMDFSIWKIHCGSAAEIRGDILGFKPQILTLHTLDLTAVYGPELAPFKWS